MIRITFFVWFTIMSILSCSAQERIRLVSGKVINDAKLFSEHDQHITYERRMSLHDLEKGEIEFIETDSSMIKFDKKGQMIVVSKRPTGSASIETLEVIEQPSLDSIVVDKVEPTLEVNGFAGRDEGQQSFDLPKEEPGDQVTVEVEASKEIEELTTEEPFRIARDPSLYEEAYFPMAGVFKIVGSIAGAIAAILVLGLISTL